MNRNNIFKIFHQITPSDESKWHPFWKKCHDETRILISFNIICIPKEEVEHTK
jgi:hypothetical protein